LSFIIEGQKLINEIIEKEHKSLQFEYVYDFVQNIVGKWKDKQAYSNRYDCW